MNNLIVNYIIYLILCFFLGVIANALLRTIKTAIKQKKLTAKICKKLIWYFITLLLLSSGLYISNQHILFLKQSNISVEDIYESPAEATSVPISAETTSVPISAEEISDTSFNINEIPEYTGKDVLTIHNNVPFFTEEEKNNTQVFVHYSDLDELGRCGTASAYLDASYMTDEKRPSITDIRPTGWHTVKYDGIDGNYLYNRGHLIGYAIAGKSENNNSKYNLITMTRYTNATTMLSYELQVIHYLEDTGNHLLYRVTPVFQGNDLVAKGVLLEAQSIEDNDLVFCVFLYNVQPGIIIDYTNGNSSGPEFTGSETKEKPVEKTKENKKINSKYVLNKNTKKIHLPSCSSVEDIESNNFEETNENIQNLLEQGYSKCKKCF